VSTALSPLGLTPSSTIATAGGTHAKPSVNVNDGDVALDGLEVDEISPELDSSTDTKDDSLTNNGSKKKKKKRSKKKGKAGKPTKLSRTPSLHPQALAVILNDNNIRSTIYHRGLGKKGRKVQNKMIKQIAHTLGHQYNYKICHLQRCTNPNGQLKPLRKITLETKEHKL
jgi:hypothetical protein